MVNFQTVKMAHENSNGQMFEADYVFGPIKSQEIVNSGSVTLPLKIDEGFTFVSVDFKPTADEKNCQEKTKHHSLLDCGK